MKKIVNGKIYDTETAKLLADYWYGSSTSDFHYIEEILYQKSNSEFFLHGKGGALTKYRETIGINSWHEGEKIIPLNENEVIEWCSQTDNDELAIELFEIEE